MRMMALTGLSKEGKGGGEKGEGNFFEDWETGEWTDYSKDSWQIRPRAFFWGKLDLAYWVPTNWNLANRALANLAPENFCFANWAPKIILAANWGRKVLCSKYITLIRRLNNCGGSNLAYFLWVGYIQNGSPKTLFLQLRGFCISVFIFATFSSMRLYWALKALNSQFHLNIWTHLEHFMIRLFFFSLYFWI